MNSTLLLLLGILISSPVHAESVGTVVATQGDAWNKSGKILFHELEPGSFVPVNPFSQYKGPTIEQKAQVIFDENIESVKITAASTVVEGQLIQTSQTGFVRILFYDDSIIDLGPNSIFLVHSFKQDQKERHIRFKLLEGKIRVLVTRKLEGRSTYEISTPGVLVSVRGTDFIVHTTLQPQSTAKTTIIGVRGQVTCDLARSARKGEVYHQQVVVNTYSSLYVKSADGFAVNYDLDDHLSGPELGDLWDEHAPYTDPSAVNLGRHPKPSELPGTGLVRTDTKTAPPSLEKATGRVAELEKIHPQNDWGGIQASGNFSLPSDISRIWVSPILQSGPYAQLPGLDPTNRPPHALLQTFSPSVPAH